MVCRNFLQLRGPSCDFKIILFFMVLLSHFIRSDPLSLFWVDLSLRPSFSLSVLHIVRIGTTMVKAHAFVHRTSYSTYRHGLYMIPIHFTFPSHRQHWEVWVKAVTKGFSLWVNLWCMVYKCAYLNTYGTISNIW